VHRHLYLSLPLWIHWIDWIKACQDSSLGVPLLSLGFSCWPEIQHHHQGQQFVLKYWNFHKDFLVRNYGIVTLATFNAIKVLYCCPEMSLHLIWSTTLFIHLMEINQTSHNQLIWTSYFIFLELFVSWIFTCPPGLRLFLHHLCMGQVIYSWKVP